jgi:hypothetical protein
VSLVLVAVVVGAGVWLLRGTTPQTPPPSGSAASTIASPTSWVVPTSPAVATVTVEASATKAPTETLKKTTVRQLTLIKKVGGSKSTGYTFVLDFLSDLSGTAAGKAWAKAHGEEWPPPNDYYFVNQSTKLRTLAVSASVSITLFSPDGATKLHPSVAALKSHLLVLGPDEDATTYSSSPFYWVTIVGGKTATKVVQQWVP